MMKKGMATLWLGLFLTTLAYATPEARDIIQQSQDQMKIDNLEMVSELILYDAKGNKRVRKSASVSKFYDNGTTEKRIISFLAPADVKGTKLLTYDYDQKDDDMWIFLPALRKARRIVSTDKSKSFMGSEFSYSDITAFSLDDFTFTLQGEATADQVPCWKIQMVPVSEEKEDEYGFIKKVVWIGQTDYVIRKATYTNFDEELEKEMTATDITLVDKKNKRYRPRFMAMENRINGRKSEMRMNKIAISDSVKDDYFTLRFLER